MKHWQLTREDNGIAIATFDKHGESANTFSTDAVAELGQILDELDRNPPKGLIFRSGKAAGFIAGADITEFTGINTVEQAMAMVKGGWDTFDRIENAKYPTLALVRGHCMGGGLELALACRYILTVDEPGTKLSLPEVMLGIFPAWGGVHRLPKRIGGAEALSMMLSGRAVDAKKAKRIGLADECVPVRIMEPAARQLLLSGTPRRPLPFMLRMMNGPLRGYVASQARKQVAKKARPQHYPAPYVIIDLWKNHDGISLKSREAFERTFSSPTTKQLIRLYFLQERMKGFGKEIDFKAKHVHVIGAGVMGGDIAAVCALKGCTVTLQDQAIERIAPAMARAHKLFSKKVRDKLKARDVADRLIPDVNGDGIAKADVIIEAIFENLEAKHGLLKMIEQRAKPDAVIATNTSSLKIEDLRTVLQKPERLVGIHFFNPVPMMPLVEIISAEGGSKEAAQKAAAFVKQIDKFPLPCKSAPGFLVNAVLAPYMHETMRALDEGLSPETIDEAMLAFGMPMGPVELMDTVGLDIAAAAGAQLVGADNPPKCLVERVTAQQFGKKSGKGFYVWKDGKPVKAAPGRAPAGLAERLVKPLLERTQKLVDDGIVADADLADAGVIFGTGFAPFTGGPLSYMHKRVPDASAYVASNAANAAASTATKASLSEAQQQKAA